MFISVRKNSRGYKSCCTPERSSTDHCLDIETRGSVLLRPDACWDFGILSLSQDFCQRLYVPYFKCFDYKLCYVVLDLIKHDEMFHIINSQLCLMTHFFFVFVCLPFVSLFLYLFIYHSKPQSICLPIFESNLSTASPEESFPRIV